MLGSLCAPPEDIGRRIWPALAASLLLGFGAAVPALAQESDNTVFWYTQLEADAARSGGLYLGRWAGQGWVGTDINRLWWKTEGERVRGAFNNAQVQALYGRYVKTFWDLQVGLRRDFEPLGVNYLVLGIQGLAPYWFDVGAAGFLSDKGKLSARTQAAMDLVFTQRLIVRPSVSLDWALGANERRGRKTGLTDAEGGVQIRYEIRRKFAPYVDLRWTHRTGKRAEVTGGVADHLGSFAAGVGLRLIF